MKLYGLIGFPLTHSFSKKYFDNKFESEQITNCSFSNFEISEINNLANLIQQNPALQGFAITIPYKQKILPYLDSMTDDVSRMLACNCVKIIDGKLVGYNTDVIGFEKSFSELLKPHHKKALVLGTGGAAQAVIFTLNKLGIEYLSVSRREQKNTITYSAITEELMNEYTAIINSTPLGTFPKVDDCPAIAYKYLTPKHYLFDLVYNPSETKFLSEGKKMGCTIKNGYDMLTIQAEENWKIWQLEDAE
jgi:shikimate dehydrogenase